MRYRIIEFLPLLVALALVAGWFGLQQPLPWLSQAPASALSPALQPVVPTPVVTRGAAIQSLCDPRQPLYLGSLASLKTRLGERMGDPIGCERQVSPDGDTEQATSKGLAYFRRRLNLAAFTTGWDHWALSGSELVHWAGTAVEPPADAAPAD